MGSKSQLESHLLDCPYEKCKEGFAMLSKEIQKQAELVANVQAHMQLMHEEIEMLQVQMKEFANNVQLIEQEEEKPKAKKKKKKKQEDEKREQEDETYQEEEEEKAPTPVKHSIATDDAPLRKAKKTTKKRKRISRSPPPESKRARKEMEQTEQMADDGIIDLLE